MHRRRLRHARPSARAAAVLTVVLSAILLSISSATADEATVTYVALGDSYSSGEGNPDFEPAAGKCDRSLDNAWPASVMNPPGAARIDFTTNLACSGALADAFTSSFRGQSPQAQALSRQRPVPGLVTITLGGNDAHFADILKHCAGIQVNFLGDCTNEVEQRRAEAEKDLPGRLQEAYRRAKEAVPTARFLVVGYPRIFPERQEDAQKCGWLTSAEREGLNRTARSLDTVIADSARSVGFEYVSTLDTFAGHELCREQSWVNPVRLDLPLSSAAGHPRAKGQAAIAEAVSRYLATRPAR